MSARDWIFTVAGAALVGAGIRDVFHTLLHPSGLGQLSPVVFRGMWRTARRVGPRATRLAGALGLATTVTVWTAMVAVGFALVYEPHLPGAFEFAPGIDRDAQGGILDALYVSMTALSTLGFGDIVATGSALRLVLASEALIGFALLTASLSWILSIYPALARRRSLAARIGVLVDTGLSEERLLRGDAAVALAPAIRGVADDLATVRVDLLQFPSSYYFEPPSREMALAVALRRLREALPQDVPPALEPAVRALDESMRGLGRTLRRPPFALGGDDGVAALETYVEDRAL